MPLLNTASDIAEPQKTNRLAISSQDKKTIFLKILSNLNKIQLFASSPLYYFVLTTI